MGNEQEQMRENRSSERNSNFIQMNKRKSVILLSLLTVFTLVFASQLPKLKFNYSFESFFPKGDTELEYYEQFNQNFGQFNDFLFIALKNDTPLSTDFLQRIKAFKGVVAQDAAVQSITSAFDLKGIQINPFGVNTYSVVTPKGDLSFESLEELGLMGNFFGRDRESVLLILRHQMFDKKQAGDAFYLQLLDQLDDFDFKDHVVSGKIQMQYDFTQQLEQELSLLLIAAFSVVIILLLLLFRSLKGILLPILILVLTLIWTMGFMAWTGKEIDVMVVMIPPILLIVALSDVIHFANKFDIHIQKEDKVTALAKSIKIIGKATLLTSVTTGIGFLGLLFLPIQPIQEFGLFTALGVLFAFLITFSVLPSYLYFFPKPFERDRTGHLPWNYFLTGFYEFINQKKIAIVWLLGLTSIAILFGISQVRVSTGIIVGLQKEEPALQKVAYFDQNFDGYKPFELGIELESGDALFNNKILQKLDSLEKYLMSEYGVAHLQSPFSLIKKINSGLKGGTSKYERLPAREDLRRIERFYNSPRLVDQRQQVQSENGTLLRIIGRTEDLGSAHYRALNHELKQFLETLNGPSFHARLTGASYLIDKTDEYVVNAILKGIGLGILSVSVFMFLFFRNINIALFTLIPNLVPIALLFGIMGWLGVDLNISTAVIFTVAFGIAVDDSIHFLARYFLEKRTVSRAEAIKNAFTQTGKSILITSLIIALGFSVFLVSGFSAAYFLGLFIVLAALIAVVFDLTLLPILLKRKKD